MKHVSELFWLLRTVWRMWRSCDRNGTAYAARLYCGVPRVTIFIGFGREAWRVSIKAGREHPFI